MIWFKEDSAEIRQAFQRICRAEGTLVDERYTLGAPLRLNGMELTYAATDVRTGEKVLLHELVPARWCYLTEEGDWQAYHAAAEAACTQMQTDYRARLEIRSTLQEESAIGALLDVFPWGNTLWTVTPYAELVTLEQAMQGKVLTPNEAITQLASLMDTLAGMHEAALWHGGITQRTVLWQEGEPLLTAWAACYCETEDGEQERSARADVRAVSLLLYQLMTGAAEYDAKTAAALPKQIAQALKNGLFAEEMTILQLWEQLLSQRPVKLAAPPKNIQEPQASSGFGRFLTRRTAVVFCLLCLLIPVVAGLFLMRGTLLEDSNFTLSASQVRVPELLYLPQEEAVTMLEEMGLHVIIASREGNPTAPINTVIQQIPAAGAVMERGNTVQLILSDGWTNYVPNVCNMPLEQATEKLAELGFVVETREVSSLGYAPGTVLTQSVAAETLLERDSVIRLMVSKGRDDVDPTKREVVGNYVGMSFAEATQLLSEIYLYAMQIEAVYDPLIPEGVIISQDIPEGRRVPQGTVINMVVSLGVETVRVPFVELMNKNSAKSLLEAAGLKAVMTYVSNTGHVIDCVISQNVPHGTLVPVGSEVWLTVSVGSDSYVVSTGGWSGDPLPTVEETTTAATAPVTETLPETTEVTEPTEPSETAATSTAAVTETEPPTVPPTAPPETETAVQTTPAPDTEPPTDPPTEAPTQAPTEVPEETEVPVASET